MSNKPPRSTQLKPTQEGKHSSGRSGIISPNTHRCDWYLYILYMYPKNQKKHPPTEGWVWTCLLEGRILKIARLLKSQDSSLLRNNPNKSHHPKNVTTKIQEISKCQFARQNVRFDLVLLDDPKLVRRSWCRLSEFWTKKTCPGHIGKDTKHWVSGYLKKNTAYTPHICCSGWIFVQELKTYVYKSAHGKNIARPFLNTDWFTVALAPVNKGPNRIWLVKVDWTSFENMPK